MTTLRAAAIGILTVLASVECSYGLEQGAWQQLLGVQLQNDYRCILAATLFVRELPKGDAVIISGRARCADGREFDFTQDKPHMKFDIRACEPAYC